MTLSPSISAGHVQGDARRVAALALAALVLFAAFAVVVYLGVQSSPTGKTIKLAPDPTDVRHTLAKAREPACAAALARASRTRELSKDEAIAASTAMLRACDIG